LFVAVVSERRHILFWINLFEASYCSPPNVGFLRELESARLLTQLRLRQIVAVLNCRVLPVVVLLADNINQGESGSFHFHHQGLIGQQLQPRFESNESSRKKRK
jgi:hypothetical protein